ncbi:helix-turn-helix domain-containing protein [Kitasatospora sp. NPDC056138]|uniref:helix-turn-helix domain-containing protein n=1 Tax=Kitasatospora sp. NPDC056138 TaxID=3345724 RepID=UPI0035DC39EE
MDLRRLPPAADTGCAMTYGLPAPALRDCVLDYRGYRMSLRQPRRRIEVPTDVVTLVLGFEGSMSLTDAVAPGTAVPFTSLVSGLRRTATIAQHGGRLHGLTVSLTPRGAYRVLGPVAGELGNQWAGISDVLGSRAPELVERLAEAPGWAARFGILDAFLTARMAEERAWDPTVAWAWDTVRASGGLTTVEQLADGTGWSRRRLELRFRAQIGIPPKQVAQIIRLQRALGAFEVRTRRDGARIAELCGFYDQAHLDRTFRGMVGCSPREFFGWRHLGADLPEPTDRLDGRVTSAVVLPPPDGGPRAARC